MAIKPVKFISDILAKKQILKVDSSGNILFSVSGTLSEGSVSSSFPVTASGLYIGDDAYVSGVVDANRMLVSQATSSFGFNGDLYGTASHCVMAKTASFSYVGNPEVGDYTDGLFTDITDTTPVGTVVDRFNEILKALAPSPAPNLRNLEKTSGATGTNMRLSFGTGINEVVNYTAVTASLSGLSNISFSNAFTASNGSGGSPIRLGVYASPIVVTMSLNNSTTADAGTFTNYPAKAFNVPIDGIGTYKLEINDVIFSPTGSTDSVSSTNTATFNLTNANTASFTSSGVGLSIFRHRIGTVGIPTNVWRSGHNYAKVTHVSSLGTHVTNYVDWVYDPSGSSGNEPYSFTTPFSASFTPTGTKYLSGIKYYTNITYAFNTTINNFYKNTYPISNGLTIGSLTSGMSAASITIPTPTLNTDTISFSNLHTLNGSVRILGTTLTSTLTAANGLGKTGSTTLTTNTVLYDNINTANTSLVENFTLENYRAASGSYATQLSASSAIGAFLSGSSLSSGELAVYNGAIRYPTQVLNNGNVASSGVVHMISGQPNYLGVNDNRTYFRVFQNGASSIATFTIGITGSTGISVIPYNSSLNANSVRIWIKVPGKTGWRDISTSAPIITTGISLDDDVGALQGTITTTATTSQHSVNLLTEALAPNEYIVLRIEASSAWTNSISKITITGL